MAEHGKRSWSTVSIFRHIYFCHEGTTMASETSENTIFVRFYSTLCYLMLTDFFTGELKDDDNGNNKNFTNFFLSLSGSYNLITE